MRHRPQPILTKTDQSACSTPGSRATAWCRDVWRLKNRPHEQGLRRFSCRLSRFPTMTKYGRFGRQNLFGLVELAALEPLEPDDFVDWQLSEQAQEAADIGIFGIAPELPVLVRGHLLFVEPYGAADALPHLCPGGGRNQGRRHAEKGAAVAPSPELDTADDVPPLVGTADLQLAGKAPRQLDKVVRLQDRIVEFEKAERLIALEPQPHTVLGQH